MIEVDDSQTMELVATLRQASDHARQQWATWLGVGSGAGIIALLSFAAALPDPDKALFLLAPALISFLLGVIFAAPSVLLLASELQAAADHFSSAHNRDSIQRAGRGITVTIASPKKMADRMNASRDKLTEQGAEQHYIAEEAWRTRTILRIVRRVCMSLSALAFVLGAAYPLILIITGASFSLSH